MVSDVVIVAAKRTPIGSFNGSLSTVAAHDLASGLIKVKTESLERDERLMLAGRIWCRVLGWRLEM